MGAVTALQAHGIVGKDNLAWDEGGFAGIHMVGDDAALHSFGSTFARSETGAANLQIDDASSIASVYGLIFDDRAPWPDHVPPSQSLFALMVREPGCFKHP